MHFCTTAVAHLQQVLNTHFSQHALSGTESFIKTSTDLMTKQWTQIFTGNQLFPQYSSGPLQYHIMSRPCFTHSKEARQTGFFMFFMIYTKGCYLEGCKFCDKERRVRDSNNTGNGHLTLSECAIPFLPRATCTTKLKQSPKLTTCDANLMVAILADMQIANFARHCFNVCLGPTCLSTAHFQVIQ